MTATTASAELDAPVAVFEAHTGIEHNRDPRNGELHHEPADQVAVIAYRDTDRHEQPFGPAEGVTVKLDSRTLAAVTGTVGAAFANLTVDQARALAAALNTAADKLDG